MVENVRPRSHPLRHYQSVKPVQTARQRQNFFCFQGSLPDGCAPPRRGCAVISVSEWPLVIGPANCTDSRPVKSLLAFPIAWLAAPPKLRVRFLCCRAKWRPDMQEARAGGPHPRVAVAVWSA